MSLPHNSPFFPLLLYLYVYLLLLLLLLLFCCFVQVPGPTIRAKAGDTLKVTFVNSLTDEDNGGDHNSYR